MTNAEITYTTSGNQEVEEQISEQGGGKNNEQDEDTEQMEQSGDSNEGNSSNDCIVDYKLDVLPL